MGTALYERGILYTANFDEASVSRSDVVRQVHEDYVRAGAALIGTNSFGANRFRLKSHGFESRVAEINVAAVGLAREVAGERVLVGASVGPSGVLLKTVDESEYEHIRQAFTEQIRALDGAGVDVILLADGRRTSVLEAQEGRPS